MGIDKTAAHDKLTLTARNLDEYEHLLEERRRVRGFDLRLQILLGSLIVAGVALTLAITLPPGGLSVGRGVASALIGAAVGMVLVATTAALASWRVRRRLDRVDAMRSQLELDVLRSAYADVRVRLEAELLAQMEHSLARINRDLEESAEGATDERERTELLARLNQELARLTKDVQDRSGRTLADGQHTD